MDAQTIADALDGKRYGNGYRAACPVCGGSARATKFSISDADDGKLLVHCFSGCGQEEVIRALRDQGLWPDSTPAQKQQWQERRREKEIDHAETVKMIADSAKARGDELSDDDKDVIEESEAKIKQNKKIEELAGLDEMTYAQKRKEAAKELGVPVRTLDKAVKEAQGDCGPGGEGNTADELVNIVKDVATLFRSEDGDGFATFDAGDHGETWGLDTEGFREWLGYKYFQQTGRAPGDGSLTTALNTLRGIAKYDGDECKVWLRCAPYQDGYLIDLCDEQWRVVQITPHGWQVLNQSPVVFTRTKAMSALPMPVGKGNFKQLWKYANVSEGDRYFVAAWMLDACRPDTPYPPLELGGFYGHAKSSTQKAIRRVIDPSRVDLRVEPKTTEDLLVSARNNHIVSLNNITHLSPARQDALCSISTGGGVGQRKFYTNSDEALFEIKRPVMINGIKTLATAPDLVDRTVRVELPKLEAYRKESELWAEFEQDHAIIFTGFLDLFTKTLEILPSVEIQHPPRMADFAHLGEALFKVLKAPDEFTAVYAVKRELAADKALEGSGVAQTVQIFIKKRVTWEGTVGELYEELSTLHTTPSAWPKTPRGLGDQLRMIAPAMAMMGYSIEFDPTRHNDGYHVALARKQAEKS